MHSTLHRPDTHKIAADRLRDRSTCLFERPVQASCWPRPEVVELRGESIYWEFERSTWDDETPPSYRTPVSPTRRMLESFVALENASSEEILRYARKWGFLGTRRTNQQFARNEARYSLDGTERWVTQHNWHCDEHNDVEFQEKYDPQSQRQSGLEPLDSWRFWSPQFAAALRIGGRLSLDECPSSYDWQIMHELDPPAAGLLCQSEMNEIDRNVNALALAWNAGEFEKADAVAKELARVDYWATSSDRRIYPAILADHWMLWKLGLPGYFKRAQATMLAAFTLKRWQRIAGVVLDVNLATARPTIETPTLFAGLVWQLLNAFGQGPGFGICSECGATYPLERKPPPGTHHPCSKDACKRAVGAKYQSESRRRKKERALAARHNAQPWH